MVNRKHMEKEIKMVQQRDVELTSSPNSSHRIPTKSWQKISYNQSCKKDPHVTR